MDKNKRKQFYINKARKVRKFEIQTGLKGFLCSCNNREKDCIREAYNLLNKYGDLLYKPTDNDEIKESSDIEDDLANEVNKMKSAEAKRFQAIDSGAKNFLFIRTTLENPSQICDAIIEDTIKENLQQTRFLIRLVPVENISKAKVDDIKSALESMIDKYFTPDVKSFSIAFNHRNNNSLSKDDVIKDVAEMIAKKRPECKVDLKNSDISVIIEVVKSFAFLSVILGYHKHKRYNLHSLCMKNDETNEVNKNAEQEDNESETCKKEVVSKDEEKSEERQENKV